MTSDPVVFLSFARTPMGSFLGELSSLKATELGAIAVRGAVERSGINPDQIDRCYMGCVLPAGLGQAPARQAAIFGGLPNTVEATTINKMCGSAMQAAIMASDALVAGSADIIVAGGLESMSNAPYLNLKHRTGARIGHDKFYDHMFMDGLEDVYEQGKLMGNFAEDVAQEYQFTREKQDEFAIASLTRAQTHADKLANEIIPVTVKTRKGEVVVDTDEQPRNANIAKIPTLKPAFARDGTITAANASSISDGAAALVMTRMSVAEKLGVKPIARVVSHAAFAQAPNYFTTAPVGSSKRALEKAGWTTRDVDLFEVNEAFATVAMIAMHDLGLPHDVLNIHGGACALGHPVGASGARILGALINGLQVNGLKRGLASICLGGGEATSMAVELV
ncbi:acetyl-CoA C-acyltransferase [Sphingomonas oligoaromativorans]|uniref:acetyl-CoA C-acyltransferase n=1 Tax=Sphingomonas oligoaromativorans TaxID=575322 RepID=UPI0014207B93|nr:acetyl-CoA C-acyltransferase [Sphingomonas oligoaromativorans]NIJ32072.1 acetyl-CoA C-acetyltransferase [Sphingomonas oligoaromativorans]